MEQFSVLVAAVPVTTPAVPPPIRGEVGASAVAGADMWAPSAAEEGWGQQREVGDRLHHQVEGGKTFLPRSSPLVGFIRHAPKQALAGQLGFLLKRRSFQATIDPEVEEEEDSAAQGKEAEVVLPRTSPYVGFQRHAPPSPTLNFHACPYPLLPLDLLPPLDEKSAGDSEDEVLSQVSTQATTDSAESTEQAACPKQLPEEVWATIFTMIPKVKEVVGMAFVAKGFHEIVMSPAAWAGTVVRLPPSSLTKFAPVLSSWLGAWSKISKLVVPRSQQLLTELSRRAPDLPVEITWRFDSHLKGEGVEVLNCGSTVRRVGEEELVVLGDAPLPYGPGRMPYIEVRLDQQGEAQGDGLNDIGIGVTACNPKDLHELGAVADEVPRSWVIDFTANTVCLSVSNREAAKSRNLSAEDLNEGDRVGLLVLEDAFEIYINGELRDRIVPAPEDRVPLNIGLYPVLDLYGRTVQISHTDYEEPTP